jgi:hypothetical protein
MRSTTVTLYCVLLLVTVQAQSGANVPVRGDGYFPSIKHAEVKGDSIWISHKGASYLYANERVHLASGAIYDGRIRGFLRKVLTALTTVTASNEGASIVTALERSTNNYVITHSSENLAKRTEFKPDDVGAAYTVQLKTDTTATGRYRLQAGGSGGIVYWSPAGTPMPTTSGIRINAAMDLIHELFHGLDADGGLLNDRRTLAIEQSEWRAIYYENVVRDELGIPLRTHYAKTTDPSNRVLAGTGTDVLAIGNRLEGVDFSRSIVAAASVHATRNPCLPDKPTACASRWDSDVTMP